MKLKLELFYIDLNNKLETKVYYKEEKKSLAKLLEKFEKKEIAEGYDVSLFSKDVITIFTKNKIIYKTSEHLENEEKEIYNILIDTFKTEIPKEYFEYRDKDYSLNKKK